MSSLSNSIRIQPGLTGKSMPTDTTAELKRALRQKEREVELLHHISQTVFSTLDLDEVLKEIIEVVVEVTKGDSCLLYLLNGEKDEFVLKASKNPHPRIIGRIKVR